MEINRFEDIVGGVAQADIVEGRFVLLTANTVSENFGSKEDLPGMKVPSTAEEATRAKYVSAFAVDNRPTPIYQPAPSMDFALRGGFDQAANLPFATTVYLTHPGNQEGMTIPSGASMLGFEEGTFTLPSGAYVYSADIIVPGAALVVEYSGADAGKPKYVATNAVGVVGETDRYDATDGRLTIRTVR
jgi:hypothetical protein